MRSAVILAGGAGSRLGEDKSLIVFNGRPLIVHVAQKLEESVDEVVVAARDQEQIAQLEMLLPQARFASDPILGYGPVAGLMAGMELAKSEYVLAIGCDLPFINTDVVERLFELAEGYDAAVPAGRNGLMEPLHAVYRREKLCLACREALLRGQRKIMSPISMLAVNKVSTELLRPLDPDLLSFFNLNSRDDLELARKIWSGYYYKDNASEDSRVSKPLSRIAATPPTKPERLRRI